MIDKIKYLATEICKNNGDKASEEVLANSEMHAIVRAKQFHFSPSEYYVTLNINPNIYAKYALDIARLSGNIKHYFDLSSDFETIRINEINLKPDYAKINILNTEISVIETPWEEINQLQKKMIQFMQAGTESIDYQNIGNTSRTILDKLARTVFNPQIHVAPSNIDLSNGKSKNQIHTYVFNKLTGSENDEMRAVVKSAIDFAENSVDLANQVVHKLDVKKHFAEICIISTITVVSLIKSIEEIQ